MLYEFYGTIENGQIILPGEQVRIRRDFLASLKDGTQVFERIGKIPHPKTDAQLKAFWGLFISHCLSSFNDNGYDTSFLLKIDKPTGIPIYGELIKDYLYNVCPAIGEDGRRITMSSMSKDQLCKFYDDCCNWAASQWGIFIPETDKEWRQKKTLHDDIKEKYGKTKENQNS